MPGTDYRWHIASDGMATFPHRGGGFDPRLQLREPRRRRLRAADRRATGRCATPTGSSSGTTSNCSGGGTPWGTWLSCEEIEDGTVWECDPTGRRKGVVHPAMGVFKHEAAAVDPRARCVYMTEDLIDGGLYRFTPERWRDLSRGAARDRAAWAAAARSSGSRCPTRPRRASALAGRCPASTRFKRGEGIWLDGHTVYVSTTADDRVHAYDTRRKRIRVVYDGLRLGERAAAAGGPDDRRRAPARCSSARTSPPRRSTSE